MRNTLLILSLLTPLSLRPVLADATTATPDRPNILWVVSEDNAPWLGCYGEPLARTPVLDRLAREGVRFTRAHSAAPVCAATRASLISGRYAPGVGTQHMRSNVPLPEGLRYYPAFLRDAGYFCTNNHKTDYNAVVLPGTWDENGNTAHWKHRKAGQPFFAILNITTTHESSLHAREALQTDPNVVRVPPYLPDTPETRADIAQYHDRIARLDGQIGEALDELDAAGLSENTIVFYYSDHGGVLPRSKRFLYANGTHIPLIVRFPEKWQHLAPSTAGSTVDELVSMIDFPPTLMSLAGIPIPAQFEGRAIAGLSKKPAPKFIHAFRDRMDECYDLSRAVIGTRFRYIRNYRPDLPAGQHLTYLWRMATMQTWDALNKTGRLTPMQQAFFQPRAPEELFDVEADPDNVHNLASDPAYAFVLAEMRAANRAHLIATRDLGFMPEPMIRERSRDRSPTAIGQDHDRYPLERLLETIDSLQLASTPSSSDIAMASRSPNPLFRYWAAISTLRSATLADDMRPLLSDEDASVRLAAAAAVLRHGDDSAAWKVIETSLQPGAQGEERLTALNFLRQLQPFPASFKLLLSTPPKSQGEHLPRYNADLAAYLLAR